MRRYVAMLTAVFLLALAAAAQTKAAPAKAPSPPANFGSAHGLCGPAHPNVEANGIVVGDGSAPTVRLLTAGSDLVFVGRPDRVAYAAGPDRMYTVVTLLTFPGPLILKSPAKGPASGRELVVSLPGGIALVGGVCTRLVARATRVRPGGTYLVFASRFDGPGSGWLASAFPVDAKTGRVLRGGAVRLHSPTGPPNLRQAVREVMAEVAREKAAAGAAGPRR